MSEAKIFDKETEIEEINEKLKTGLFSDIATDYKDVIKIRDQKKGEIELIKGNIERKREELKQMRYKLEFIKKYSKR